MAGITPFQTIGPYFQVLLRDAPRGVVTLSSANVDGRRVRIDGRVLDGRGQPVVDALIETWQADAQGRYRHPEDPRAQDLGAMFDGYGRVHTDEDGRFMIDTILPGPVIDHDAEPQAPHLLVSIVGRGILTRYVTRMYFEGQPLNTDDAVLATVPAHRRETLIARRREDGRYAIDLVLQGPGETVFFAA